MKDSTFLPFQVETVPDTSLQSGLCTSNIPEEEKAGSQFGRWWEPHIKALPAPQQGLSAGSRTSTRWRGKGVLSLAPCFLGQSCERAGCWFCTHLDTWLASSSCQYRVEKGTLSPRGAGKSKQRKDFLFLMPAGPAPLSPSLKSFQDGSCDRARHIFGGCKTMEVTRGKVC